MISPPEAESIPVLDMEAYFQGKRQSKETFAGRVGDICHSVGFFYLINHGIPDTVCQSYLSMIKAFFALPESVKASIDKSGSSHFRGWEKLGSELTNNRVDYREQLDLGVDRKPIVDPDPYYLRLVGPNQWPDEKALPGFRKVVEEFFQRLSDLSASILDIMSLSLGLPEYSLSNAFGDEPSPYLKLIRYPPGEAGSQGVGVHKDSGFLTLLLQDEVSGLEAQSANGHWMPIPPLEGALVVNIGELLQMMTKNYFIATPHRVLNTSGRTRYSSAFFYSPDLNTRLNPLPLSRSYLEKVHHSDYHREAGFMASKEELGRGIGGMHSRRVPEIFGYKYWQRWVRSYPEITRKYHADIVEKPFSSSASH